MNARRIGTPAEFLAHVLALRNETMETFSMFADQMEVVNNHDTAAVFRRLVEIQRQRLLETENLCTDYQIPQIAAWDFHWGDAEVSKVPTASDTHYLMTPYHALELAVTIETQVVEFYSTIAGDNTGSDLGHLAKKHVIEGMEYIEQVQSWLNQYSPPSENWDEDPDPPNLLE